MFSVLCVSVILNVVKDLAKSHGKRLAKSLRGIPLCARDDIIVEFIYPIKLQKISHISKHKRTYYQRIINKITSHEKNVSVACHRSQWRTAKVLTCRNFAIEIKRVAPLLSPWPGLVM